MNEMVKKLFVCAFIVMFSVVCTGCITTRYGTDNAVLEHQRQLAEYQATVNAYIRRTDASAERIESIRGRADSLTTSIDGVISLFDEYQRAVERLLQDYYDLRRAIETAEKDINKPVDDSSGIDSD